MQWFVLSLCYLNFVAGNTIGEECQISEEVKGVCVNVLNCGKAVEGIKNNNFAKTCWFEGLLPIICCHKDGVVQNLILDSNTTTEDSISAQKCKSWDDYISEDVIAGGTAALTDEFPHMAALGFGNDINKIEWQCGGSLISKKFILTAAHCLKATNLGPVKWARLGTLEIRNTNLDPSKNLEIIRTFRHPDYRPPKQYHDIGLVELKNEVGIKDGHIFPICLHTGQELPEEIPTATGWGRLTYAGDTSDALLKVSLHYFNNSYCNKVYKNINKRKLPEGIKSDTQICAGGLNEEKDTCQGDSGGPLQVRFDKFVLIGITSFGKGCGIANIPGVYTRVSHYLPWIESIVWTDEYEERQLNANK